MFAERDYQVEAVEAVEREWARGIRATLVVLATGLGKTVVASRLIGRTAPEERVLFLAHREELVNQTREKVRQITGKRVAVECGQQKAYKTDPFAPVIVATEQSLVRRLQRYKPDHFTVLVDDESHHATGNTRRAIRDHFTGLKRIVGLTATPNRHDEEALGKVFETVSINRDIHWGIDNGWLTPIRNRVVACRDLDMRKVGLRAGEFDSKALSEILGRQALVERIVRQTVAIADGRQTIVYCHSVDQANAVHRVLQQVGERSIYIDGSTEKNFIRPERIRAFREQRVQFFVNVAVATEGLDVPGIEVVAMARPTRSRVLFIQCAGRGLRPSEPPQGETAADRCREIAASKKPWCTLIDFVGQLGAHSMQFGGDLLGGNYDDEVRKLAMRMAAEIEGDIDMRAVLEEAREKVEKREARRTERERQIQANRDKDKELRSEERKWQFSFFPNPYDAWKLDPKEAATLPSEMQYGRRMEEARKVLEEAKFKWSEIQRLTALEQVYLARTVVLRAKRNLASWPQSRIVYIAGYDASVMTKRMASAVIDRIKKCDWMRPPEDGPNPVFMKWRESRGREKARV